MQCDLLKIFSDLEGMVVIDLTVGGAWEICINFENFEKGLSVLLHYIHNHSFRKVGLYRCRLWVKSWTFLYLFVPSVDML
jgi:hypothetical protein